MTAKTSRKARRASKPTLGILPYKVGVKVPQKASEKASCYDIEAYVIDKEEIIQYGQDNKEIPTYVENDSFYIHPFSRAIVPTGLKLDIPDGYDVRIYPRSGLSIKLGLTLANNVGVIDNDYRGEVGLVMVNLTSERIKITSGMRLAQMELNKLWECELKEITPEEHVEGDTKRGEGGFGSTGTTS